MTLKEQLDPVKWGIGKIIKKHTHECHGVIIFDDDTAIPELAALVREREEAAHLDGRAFGRLEHAIHVKKQENKEQPK